MAKSTRTGSEDVTAHISQLESPVAETVEKLRQAILATNSEIGEHIKWNSPAFYYTGEMQPFDPKEYKRDIVVMNLHRGKLLMVFPTGARITDPTGILEGAYTDGRRIVTIKDAADAESKTVALQQVISEWLRTIHN